MLFNEPKLLKSITSIRYIFAYHSFSALQRAEIAEIKRRKVEVFRREVSVLFNEPKLLKSVRIFLRLRNERGSFSALQRAEIAEIPFRFAHPLRDADVSVLFNEPKLLKSGGSPGFGTSSASFSALQRAEIAEIHSARR